MKRHQTEVCFSVLQLKSMEWLVFVIPSPIWTHFKEGLQAELLKALPAPGRTDFQSLGTNPVPASEKEHNYCPFHLLCSLSNGGHFTAGPIGSQ